MKSRFVESCSHCYIDYVTDSENYSKYCSDDCRLFARDRVEKQIYRKFGITKEQLREIRSLLEELGE